ncbi:threonine synthase [Lactiplantibacillus pentosus]|uniref:Threonine synthase n=1 Tax=Lactiplantibacillus pentosus TaxID=1589 RepID=A0AB37RHH7_LACPE|nr:threonine synthase [Lactiplantibacillus pentosus]RMW43435.1 threonine synthase [Lactiplantibacillus pentosus]RMW46025.1 threonine synthase [Lactiplantibacillus pentosus]RMW53833.1 threonine synthase [Lactiplantibacillus pentosus]RMW55004.1 threonine synthase [Lactiplantibacillus pentosus]WFC02496.1 threonine synthase [Lactiplantibacillus pentosus]
MNTLYRSTRETASHTMTSSQAVLQGLTPDGGLFVPVTLPTADFDFEQLANMSYQEVAYEVLKLFFTDYTAEELHACIDAAYGAQFDDPAIAPVTKHGNQYYLELFHGPTIAFKDLALQILPHLMTTAVKKNHLESEIVILAATSGDTGKAAMAGFADVDQTKIIVFYPKDGVSAIQKQQMITQTGDNTNVVAINGNFDEAQTTVKQLLNDPQLRQRLADHQYQFSSANSINIGRLFPQVAYYVYTYAQLIHQGHIKNGDAVNFSVPTGNFGDILAGYYAKQLGTPIHKLVCASNRNNVLTDFFNTGTYDKNREFYLTSSPSMDILVSSNLERLIFYLTGEDPLATAQLMQDLQTKGSYTITPAMRANLADFWAGFVTENQDQDEIHHLNHAHHYTIDPHTAVASAVAKQYRNATKDQRPMVVVSTASPYKFPQAVLTAITGESTTVDGLTAVDQLHDLIQTPIPPTVTALRTAPVRHNRVAAVDKMGATIESILNLN